MGLVKQSDIARLLGISRQAVSKLVKNRAKNGFPEPVRDGVWDDAEVLAWQANR